MMQIKKIEGEDDAYEGEWFEAAGVDSQGTRKAFDYHIRKENKMWFVDGFDATISDKESANIGSNSFGTFQGAIDFILTDGFRP